MTDRRGDRDIEQSLSAWMEGAAPAQAPTRLLEDTFGQTMKTGQVRVYPWDRIRIGPRPSTGAGSQTRIVLVLAGALLVVAMVAAITGGGVHVPASSPSPSPSASGSAPPPTLPPSTSIAAVATIPVKDLLGFESDGTFLWGLAPGRIDRIDPTKNKVTGSAPLGPVTDLYNGLAVNDAGLWATDWDSAALYRVDKATLKVVTTIPVGLAPKGVLANADGVWVADTHGGAVLRVDPATNKVIATISVGRLGNSGPNWLASGLGSIWTDIPNNGTVARIDAVSGTIQATFEMPFGFIACGGFAIASDAVWVSGCDASAALWRLDPRTNTPVSVVPIPGHGGPTFIGDALWVSVDGGDASTGMLVRIDPATNTIDRVLLPDAPFGGGGGIVVAAGSVWVSDGYNNVVLRFPLATFGA